MFAFIPSRARLRAKRTDGSYSVIAPLFRYSTCLILLVAAVDASEPISFRAFVDQDSITVGDLFTLNLLLELPADQEPKVLPEIGLPESFRVVGAPEAVREDLGEGRERWRQSIRLTSFRPGETEISALKIKVIGSNGDTTLLSDNPIPVLVQSVKPDSLTDILDVKAPVSIDPVIPMWTWMVVGLAVVALLIFFLWYRRWMRGGEERVTTVVVVDWFDEVRKLRVSGLIEEGAFNAYYTRLSESLRRFIEQSTGVVAMERTTHEIRADLLDASLSDSRILDVENFLNDADLVKFAKFEPNADRASRDSERVLSLMSNIEQEYRARVPDTVDTL